MLRELFPTTALKELAMAVGHTYSSTYSKCNVLGLKKSAEYRRAYLAINRVNATKANTGREPWNKAPGKEVVCKWCQKPFLVAANRIGRAVFCARPCMSAWRKTVTGENHWLYTLETRNCQWCQKEFKAKPAKIKAGEAIFCGRRCMGSSTSFAQGQHKGPTSIERKLSECLTAKGIVFVTQHQIGPWCVDAFVPSLNLVIEADGDYWHSLPNVVVRDKKKTGYLRKAGYTVARLTETQINQDVNAAVSPFL